MRIRGIIFDLDGTLVHTIEDIVGAANAMLAENGLPTHQTGAYLTWIGSGAFRLIEQACGQPVEEGKLREFVTRFKEIYSGNLHDKSRLYPGVAGLLDRLVEQGLSLSILSNKPHLLTRQVADFYLSNWPLDPVFGQREEVPRKPDPAGALEIAEQMGFDPPEILFVGDSNNDILTALAAGMVPVGVSWGYGRLPAEGVEGDYPVIDHPDELLPIALNQS